MVTKRDELVTSSTLIDANLLLRGLVHEEEMWFGLFCPQMGSGVAAAWVELKVVIADFDDQGMADRLVEFDPQGITLCFLD